MPTAVVSPASVASGPDPRDLIYLGRGVLDKRAGRRIYIIERLMQSCSTAFLDALDRMHGRSIDVFPPDSAKAEERSCGCRDGDRGLGDRGDLAVGDEQRRPSEIDPAPERGQAV